MFPNPLPLPYYTANLLTVFRPFSTVAFLWKDIAIIVMMKTAILRIKSIFYRNFVFFKSTQVNINGKENSTNNSTNWPEKRTHVVHTRKELLKRSCGVDILHLIGKL